MKTLERHGLLLLLAVAGLLVAADYYKLPWLSSLGIIVAGLIACLGGIRAIIRGEVFEGRSRLGNPRFVARHTGISARLIGVTLLFAGPILVVLGAMEFSGAGRAGSFLSELPDTPYGWAAILGLAGAMVTTMGIARSMSGSALPKGTWDRHVELSIRLGGAISAVVGLAMLLLAIGVLLVPGLPQELAEQLKRLVEQVVTLAEAWASNQ